MRIAELQQQDQLLNFKRILNKEKLMEIFKQKIESKNSFNLTTDSFKLDR